MAEIFLWSTATAHVAGDAGAAWNNATNAQGEPDDTVSESDNFGPGQPFNETKRLQATGVTISPSDLTTLQGEGVNTARLIVRLADPFGNVGTGAFMSSEVGGVPIDTDLEIGTIESDSLTDMYTTWLDETDYPLVVISDPTFKVSVKLVNESNFTTSQVDTLGIAVNGTPPPPPPPPPTDYYVDFENGSDSNDGITPATPCKTMTGVWSARLSNPAGPTLTIHVAGVSRNANWTQSNFDDATFRQWEGQDQAIIAGDQPLSGTWTQVGSTDAWDLTVASGLDCISVACDWWDSVTAGGSHYGHLREADDATDCETNPNSWFRVNSTTLRVNLNGDDPNSHEVAALRSAQGWKLTGVSGLRFEGIKFALWAETTEAYGLWVSGHDNTITDCEFYDCWKHGWGFVSSNCYNNTVEGGITDGIGAGGTLGVFHDNSGQAFSTNNVARNHTGRGHTFLGRDQLPIEGDLDSAGTINAAASFYSHSGGGNKLNGQRWEDCTVIDTNGQTHYIGAGDADDPADPTDQATYNIHAIRCQYLTARQNQMLGSPVAYVNNRLQFTRAHISGDGNASIWHATGAHLFLGCYITTEALSDLYQKISGSTGVEVYFINCTGILSADTQGIFTQISGSATIHNWANLWAGKAGGSASLVRAGSPTMDNFGNAYWNIDDTSADPDGLVLAEDPFVDINTSGELTSKAYDELRTSYKAKNFTGYNGVIGSGNIGAWQKAYASMRGRPSRERLPR